MAGRVPLHWSAASFASSAMVSTTVSAFELVIMTATIEKRGATQEQQV